MNTAKLFCLFFLLMLINVIKDTKCSDEKEKFSQNISFLQSKIKNGEKNMPGIFDLFSVKPNSAQPNFNFFLEENRNFWLRRTLNDEKNRNIRRNFADFQELRQNDLLRFEELMIIQNEQINIIKNIIYSI
ncbi:conserved Plasmodium protein, unknown function [Plasmodium gallinaceum]|uniref:Fam-b protein n=1 Tax=Plasmodium gallinaceum TaxID=5849 RepID=A0A1J1GU22_PLAGA|nr:conserved Plasmodium protein, unknown function [Plasmodium gallinaceum]CRG94814.1 conserved Plasmodium protein, unknown function [Plasmodium gallinaceum]